jgi:TolA-binding protein
MDFLKFSVTSFLVFALLVLSGTAHSQTTDTNGTPSLVQGRLTSDLSRLGNQLTQLNQTVNQLQTEVSQLKTENQRQQIRIDSLERLVNRLQKKLVTLKNNRGSEPTVETSPPAPGSDSVDPEEDNVWISQPDINYTIRKTPLDHEITYVTTDDTILTRLAHRYYRNAGLWEEIYRLNSDKLPSPNVIPPGIRLRLPPISELN